MPKKLNGLLYPNNYLLSLNYGGGYFMKRFSLFTILFALLSGFMFFSCEVGLGEAIDTEAPKITINYPESKAIVRDSFVLAGTCSDDIADRKSVV